MDKNLKPPFLTGDISPARRACQSRS